ncbi:MAG TPA: Mrp/NBP35 family ATP-binding protein [Vampirovibrionales bacterium]
MNQITPEKAKAALATVEDPDLKKDLVTLNMARNIEVSNDGQVSFNLVLTTPACPLRQQIEDDCKKALIDAGAKEVNIETTAEVRGFRGLGGKQPIEGVKNIIAVSSGKGGVGKSTVSVNLAISLARKGAKVGLLDADITGPNVPIMLGLQSKPELSNDGKRLLPPEKFGIKIMSMGLLIGDSEPVVWRGPMLHSAINQFFRDVDWGDLDYLVIDLPPGTGDAQLTICQSVPIAGTVIVSTPQDVALLDSRKGLAMFEKMNVAILGVVENMSYFIAPDTGNRYEIFGSNGAKKAAEELGFECFGQLPIQQNIREGGDFGQPITSADPENEVSKLFASIAEKVAARVSIVLAKELANV